MSDTSALSIRLPRQMRPASLARHGRAVWSFVKRRHTPLLYLMTAVIIYVGWAGRAERNITAEYGLGYILGIVGASMMGVLLLYPVRKRVKLFRNLGTTEAWFSTHIVFGIVGPVLILYHSNFQLGSLNSRVALYCTLLVAGSGIIGRYLYTQFHSGLHGRKLTLQSLVKDLQESSRQISKAGGLLQEIQQHLALIDTQVLTPPETILESAIRPLLMSFKTRWAYVRLSWIMHRKLIAGAMVSRAISEHQRRLEATTRKYLSKHLREVRAIAHLNFYERMFSFWHVLHLPFFLMLVISAIVHVIAVHMY